MSSHTKGGKEELVEVLRKSLLLYFFRCGLSIKPIIAFHPRIQSPIPTTFKKRYQNQLPEKERIKKQVIFRAKIFQRDEEIRRIEKIRLNTYSISNAPSNPSLFLAQ